MSTRKNKKSVKKMIGGGGNGVLKNMMIMNAASAMTAQPAYGPSVNPTPYVSAPGYAQPVQYVQQPVQYAPPNPLANPMVNMALIGSGGGGMGGMMGNMMLQQANQQQIQQLQQQLVPLQNKLNIENKRKFRSLGAINDKAISLLTPIQQQVIKFYNLDTNVLKQLNPPATSNGTITPTNKQKGWLAAWGANLTKSIKVGTFIKDDGTQFEILLKNDGWISDNNNFNYDFMTTPDSTAYNNGSPKEIAPVLNNPPTLGYQFISLTALATNIAGTPLVFQTQAMIDSINSQISGLQGQQQMAQFNQTMAMFGGSKSKKSKKPATKKPTTKKPITKKPATKKPVSKKPKTKKPTTKKPATKKPVTKKPVSKKPKTKKPVSKKPKTKKAPSNK
jgi:hypothetical protein